MTVIADALQPRADGYGCDLTYGDLADRTKLSERHVRRMLAKTGSGEPGDSDVCRLYPRLFSWQVKRFTLAGVDLGGRHNLPLRFVWIGDTRTADEIAATPEPVRVYALSDTVAELRTQAPNHEDPPAPNTSESEQAPVVASQHAPLSDDEREYQRLVGVLRDAQNPARMLDVLAGMTPTMRFVSRLRADAEVQALLRRPPVETTAPVQAPRVEF